MNISFNINNIRDNKQVKTQLFGKGNNFNNSHIWILNNKKGKLNSCKPTTNCMGLEKNSPMGKLSYNCPLWGAFQLPLEHLVMSRQDTETETEACWSDSA